MSNSNLEREHCKTIIQKDYSLFLKKRNVVGLAFGNKTIKNINITKPCLIILVNKKESISNLTDNDLIPEIYDGIITDIVETGELSHHSLNEKKLPLQFGYSIGPSNFKPTGTAGCLVKDKLGNYYILSNNHVLSDYGKLPIGTPILHPAMRDGGSYPEDLIAILSKVSPILFSSEFEGKEFLNYVDCAIAKVINPALVTKKIALIGSVKGVVDPELNLNIKKVGRTSELTTGKISMLDGLVKIQTHTQDDVIYHNQIITTPISQPGDSGALVLDENNNAVGLLFGGGNGTAFVNPIKSVLTALDVSIVTS